MAVDFGFKRAPAYRVAAVAWKGPWSDARVRAKFQKVVSWARARHLRTGKWIFREPTMRSFEVAIEVRGKARSEGGVRVKTYPGARVVSVVFDPDVVSARVVYHGVTDWLRWRKKEKEIRSVGDYREVYAGSPWTDKKAYARTEVQVVVRP
jgi:effector-binding domain-containing protein